MCYTPDSSGTSSQATKEHMNNLLTVTSSSYIFLKNKRKNWFKFSPQKKILIKYWSPSFPHPSISQTDQNQFMNSPGAETESESTPT